MKYLIKYSTSALSLLIFSIYITKTTQNNVSESGRQNLIHFPGDPIIYKCHCDSDEILTDTGCQEYETEVYVWTQNESVLKRTSDFTVIKEPITCEKGFSKIFLESKFILYPNGSILNLHQMFPPSPPSYDYCIEHFLNELGQLAWRAEKCEPQPLVPACCYENNVLTKDYICEPVNDSVAFVPPSYIYDFFIWTSIRHTVYNVSCDFNHVSIKAKLEPYELSGYPYLAWKSPFSRYYLFGEYCIAVEKGTLGEFSVNFCSMDPVIEDLFCQNNSCIRKCCSEGYQFNETNNICYPHYYDSDVTDFPFNQTIYNMKQLTSNNVAIVYGPPNCNFGDLVLFDPLSLGSDKRTLLSNGSILSSDGLLYTVSKYCLDDFVAVNGSLYESGLACIIALESPCLWRFVVGSVFLALSCLFYAMILVVYIGIQELRSTMRGRCRICQVAALFISYLTLIVLQNSNDFSTWRCNVPGTIEHIAILASFFWLNVLCYDVWKNIRVMRRADTRRGGHWRQFILYCLYAWGTPLLIGVVRLTIDHLNVEEHSWLIKANLGQTHCFFSDNYSSAKWIYLYAFILLLLLVNLAMFIHVAYFFVQHRKQNKNLLQSNKENKFNSLAQRVKLNLKLFLSMGIPWVLEIVLWISVPENDCYFWGLDLVNMLQGVYIFYIFVCDKATLDKVKSRFFPCLTLPGQTKSNAIPLTADATPTRKK